MDLPFQIYLVVGNKRLWIARKMSGIAVAVKARTLRAAICAAKNSLWGASS